MPRNNRGRRTDYQWQFGNFDINAQSAGAAGAILFTAASSLTVFRLRGTVYSEIDGTATAAELVRVTVGFIQIPSSLSATGGGLEPEGDREESWLWSDSFILSGENAAGGSAHGTKQVDSKAMRRMKPNERILAAWIVTTIGGAAAVNISGGLNMLVGT